MALRNAELLHWILKVSVSLLSGFVFLFLSVEMTLSEPGETIIAPNGEHIICEARAPRSKSSKRRCSVLGSFQTRPKTYAFVLAATLVSFGAFWVASGKGRTDPP